MTQHKRLYRATAINDKGDTFRFVFMAFNWSGIDALASARLAEVVSEDALHQKNGPWRHQNIDLAA